jgi:hypothetical protein
MGQSKRLPHLILHPIYSRAENALSRSSIKRYPMMGGALRRIKSGL